MKACLFAWFTITSLTLVIVPLKAHAQSQDDKQVTQQLQKELEQLRGQMNKVQAQLDDLEAEKANQPGNAPPSQSTQGGSIQTSKRRSDRHRLWGTSMSPNLERYASLRSIASGRDTRPIRFTGKIGPPLG